MDKDQTLLQTPLMDADQVRQRVSPTEAGENLKLIEGKNGSTTFLSPGPKLGGENTDRKINKSENTNKEYLTTKQAKYVCRKVKLGSLINKITIRQEVDQDIELDKMDDTSGEENLYRELIVNNTGKIETILSQMEQWLIFSILINYVQYDKNPRNFHTMSTKCINKMKDKIKSKNDERERSILEIDFVNTSDRLKEEYLDRYEGVESEILSTTRFNENSDLSTTSLGKASRNKDNKISTEEKFPISE